MNYSDLIPKLRLNHFYPSILTLVKKDMEVITSLEISVSPLLKDQTVDNIQKIVGEGFSVSYVSTNESIQITKKK